MASHGFCRALSAHNDPSALAGSGFFKHFFCLLGVQPGAGTAEALGSLCATSGLQGLLPRRSLCTTGSRRRVRGETSAEMPLRLACVPVGVAGSRRSLPSRSRSTQPE